MSPSPLQKETPILPQVQPSECHRVATTWQPQWEFSFPVASDEEGEVEWDEEGEAYSPASRTLPVSPREKASMRRADKAEEPTKRKKRKVVGGEQAVGEQKKSVRRRGEGKDKRKMERSRPAPAWLTGTRPAIHPPPDQPPSFAQASYQPRISHHGDFYAAPWNNVPQRVMQAADDGTESCLRRVSAPLAFAVAPGAVGGGYMGRSLTWGEPVMALGRDPSKGFNLCGGSELMKRRASEPSNPVYGYSRDCTPLVSTQALSVVSESEQQDENVHYWGVASGLQERSTSSTETQAVSPVQHPVPYTLFSAYQPVFTFPLDNPPSPSNRALSTHSASSSVSNFSSAHYFSQWYPESQPDRPEGGMYSTHGEESLYIHGFSAPSMSTHYDIHSTPDKHRYAFPGQHAADAGHYGYGIHLNESTTTMRNTRSCHEKASPADLDARTL
nr:hypothetical protein L203_00746 [Cryptococcus depauperatus CBS 7841]